MIHKQRRVRIDLDVVKLLQPYPESSSLFIAKASVDIFPSHVLIETHCFIIAACNVVSQGTVLIHERFSPHIPRWGEIDCHMSHRRGENTKCSY